MSVIYHTADPEPEEGTHRGVWTLDSGGQAIGDEQHPDIVA